MLSGFFLLPGDLGLRHFDCAARKQGAQNAIQGFCHFPEAEIVRMIRVYHARIVRDLTTEEVLTVKIPHKVIAAADGFLIRGAALRRSMGLSSCTMNGRDKNQKPTLLSRLYFLSNSFALIKKLCFNRWITNKQAAHAARFLIRPFCALRRTRWAYSP